MSKINLKPSVALLALLIPTAVSAQGQDMPASTLPDVDSIAAAYSGRYVPQNPAIPAAQSVVMSLEECSKVALDKNPTVIVSGMEIKRADYSKKETLAQLLPNVSFGLQYSRAIELQSMKMNFGGTTQTIKMGQDNSWGLGFTASMPVIAPTLWKSLQLSDTQIMASVEASRGSALDLINQVERAYYSLLLAKASRKVLLQNYDNAVFNADLYKKKFDAGTASEYDVLRSSVQVKNAEPELLQADIAVHQAQLQLAILLALDPGVAIEPDTSLEEYQREMFARESAGYSLADNTQLRSMLIQRKALEQTVAMRKLDWVPTLSANVNLMWNSISNGNMFKHIDLMRYSTAGFSVSVPIFSGGSKYYGLKNAKVQLAENTLQTENLQRSLQTQLELAVDNINKEVTQIESSAEGVRQAEKAHQIMQKSFEIGAATYLDLRDSELAETSSRLSYYQAIYNYLVSHSDLDLLLGRGVPPSGQNN